MNKRIKDIPKVDRPREKMLARGVECLSDTELLAVLLGSGIRGQNVKMVAADILRKVKKQLINVSREELEKIRGVGPAKAGQLVAAFTLAKRYLNEDLRHVSICRAEDVFKECRELVDKKQEYLMALYLDANNCLIKKQIVSIGTVNASIVHPREIFAPAIENRAVAVILAHNHPDGNLEPTDKDLEITTKIVDGGKLLDIAVLDHVLVSKKGYYSIFEKVSGKEGYLKETD